MPLITFSDGNTRYYTNAVSIMDIALNISKTLAKSCIAGKVNCKLVDCFYVIDNDATIDFITIKDTEGLEIIRRSCVQLLGYAIKTLWPESKIATNRIINDDFYCDFDIKHNLNHSDIDLLEKCMHKLANTKYDIVKKVIKYKEAHNLFLSKGETYKLQILDEYVNQEDNISTYIHEKYLDICEGPQVPNISFCRYFKLQKVSGIYWKGDKNNKMLQRIYGTAWADKQQLSDYIHRLEETSKRDHRRIGKQLDLYHIEKESPGMIFWHHNGWIIFDELQKFISDKLREYHYKEVKSPLLMDRKIWEQTGHWQNYQELMFKVNIEHHEYCIKPMNCPGHLQIFNQGVKSYRDLPIRMAEFGSCHRNEPSGALHGLMRVCNFTQDDAHIFCTEEQLKEEINKCINMIYEIYHIFGFKKIVVHLATRPKQRIGTDKIWDHAEKNLECVLKANNIDFLLQHGEGAFYGPKIEFTLFDCLNRAWQCGTIQLDFSLPKCLNATYIDQNNHRRFPVMIHRAILGSIERFIGILIEEYSGLFPTWLSPIQIVITSVTDKYIKYVENLTSQLYNEGFRAISDLRSKKLGFKIREHTINRIPYILIYGEEEIKKNKISVRTCCGKDLGLMDVNIFIQKLKKEIYTRKVQQMEE
ncbi:threonine--tRNA ligase [Candidatus Pantoea edessiphila]|uniref:Threonine--tRNA ligase n=1 Tax=Candidatus Pantoea edessiphila TaxID=2044610 RepID=A0A2P5SYW6_9GAMM|nr:threonine--tRNA ligase [Candidatus Pantoea edessiphila]MBK4775377.1 threonine--tRNA ligase [Pantoea sp. Edef]PPI87492.1 threonine--tRNA ligase [Candidatus Pantoea edessiphila]